MNGLILVNNNIEDGETIIPRDLLIRAGINVTLVSLTNSLNIKTAYNLNIKADKSIKDINLDNFDFLIIPGGSWVYNSLNTNHKLVEKVKNIINNFNKRNKLIAAICAAPVFLNELLENKKFTCYKGFEQYINGIYTAKGVELTNNIITAGSVSYAYEFSFEIIKYLYNDNKVLELKKEILYNY